MNADEIQESAITTAFAHLNCYLNYWFLLTTNKYATHYNEIKRTRRCMPYSKSNEHVRRCTRTKGESLEKTKEIHSIYYRRMQLRLKFSPLASAHQDMRLRNVF